jgi:hypothetical protein
VANYSAVSSLLAAAKELDARLFLECLANKRKALGPELLEALLYAVLPDARLFTKRNQMALHHFVEKCMSLISVHCEIVPRQFAADDQVIA